MISLPITRAVLLTLYNLAKGSQTMNISDKARRKMQGSWKDETFIEHIHDLTKKMTN